MYSTGKNKRIVSFMNREARNAEREFREKYERKREHLKEKHRTEERRVPENKKKSMKGRYEADLPELYIYKDEDFNKELEERHDNSKDLKIMKIGEVELSKEEQLIARYPPGQTINPTLKRTGFINDIEQGITNNRMECKKQKNYNFGRLCTDDPNYSRLSDEQKLRQ